MSRFSFDERSVVEAQALVEIDSQLKPDGPAYVNILDWDWKLKPYLGPFWCFLQTHPQRYECIGNQNKYRVRKTREYTAQAGDDPAMGSEQNDARPPPRAIGSRKHIECRYWKQGHCLHGDACHFAHGETTQWSASYAPRRADRTNPYSMSQGNARRRSFPAPSLANREIVDDFTMAD